MSTRAIDAPPAPANVHNGLMVEFREDIEVVELELFDAAEPIAPGAEDEARRRFMTLFAHAESGRRGGSADVVLATNAQGEHFAMKRLHVKGPSDRQTAQPLGASAANRRKELRNSLESSGASEPNRASAQDGSSARDASPTPDYITEGHAAAFFEEYRTHLAVSNLRGFPGLYGFGMAGGNPLILMEWVQGCTLRDALRERAAQDGSPLPLQAVASLGIAVLQLLERANGLRWGFVHRDISPRNIMLRTDRKAAATQLESADFDLCLVDFGSAAMPSGTPADPTFTTQAGVWRMGTPAYAPPEMLTSDVALPAAMRRSPSIDVYALAGILYELYTGRKPFSIEPGGLAPYRLKTETSPTPPELREPDGGALAGIIMAGLATDQATRPTVAQMRQALENWKLAPQAHDAGLPHAGKPAKANIWQPDFTARKISRRKFIAGGIVAAGAVMAAGILGGSLGRRIGAVDTSRYPRASGPYGGEPLFKAFDGESNGWVFCTAAGEIACKPASSRAPGAMREGMAALFDDAAQRYGYIAPTGDATGYAWVVLPAFAQAGDFSEGLAAAQDAATGLWGYIDAQGSWAIPPSLHTADAFRNGAAAVQLPDEDMAWGAIDASGAWLLPPAFPLLGSRDASGCAIAWDPDAAPSAPWGILDAAGEWTNTARFAKLRRLAEGLAPALDADVTGLWGYIDARGNWALEPAFADARPFSEGLAAVQDAKTGLWRFIGPDGKPYANMKPRFWKLGDMHDGLAPAQASLADDAVVFDDADPTAFAEGAAKRYGYVDEAGTWQMRKLTRLVDAAIGPAPL